MLRSTANGQRNQSTISDQRRPINDKRKQPIPIHALPVLLAVVPAARDQIVDLLIREGEGGFQAVAVAGEALDEAVDRRRGAVGEVELIGQGEAGFRGGG